MASEDVIELGSSDEEPAPARKKAKPRPNAMVHIPGNLPNIAIRPGKSNVNPIKKLLGKELTIKKVNQSPTNNPTIAKKKNLNGKAVIGPILTKPQLMVKNPIPISGSMPITIPLPKSVSVKHVMGAKVVNTNLIKKVPNKYIGIPANACPLLINTKSLRKLPPGVTTAHTYGNKRQLAGGTSNVKKKQKITPNRVTTVELDDDDSPTTSTAGPQWYLRPEEPDRAMDPLSMEQKNNVEPEPKMIEITIEDSPSKPALDKRTYEIGAELPITIEDSPSKPAPKATTSVGSDDESADRPHKVPHSKKKLDYSKAVETTNTIEIEIEPYEVPVPSELDTSKDVTLKESVGQKEVIEIIESPLKKTDSSQGTPKKQEKQNHIETKRQLETVIEIPESGEFHPVYEQFIDLCFKIENSNDMKTIVEKKIKSYYRQCPKEYTESEDFIEMVTSKILAMKADPEKLYLYIKDIVDELNMQRKIGKSKVEVAKETREIEAEKFQYGEESEFDSKRQRQIRKLEKTIRKLHRAIQKLEEQEVDFDDEEDSVYLLTERYKERMVRVHAKLCQLTNTKMPSEPRITIEQRPGQPAGPAKRLEKWVNRKVPIGKPLPFPDFHDVLRCVKEANEEDRLGWNDADIMEEARDLFTRCGKKLQRRRQENEWRLAASRISAEADPAEISEELKKKLESNRQLATKKETDVFNKFADKQSLLKLEAVEIGDKEAEESPIESEDEEDVVPQTSALENKEGRKGILRRIIHEKTKKNTDEKQNEPNENADKQVDAVASSEKISEESENKEKEDLETKNKQEPEKMSIDVDTAKEMNEEKMDVDKVSQEPQSLSGSKESIHSISDEIVDSDVDELHLLQKLHSDEVNSSTIESSDSDSPIDISDTLQSSSDSKEKQNSDVISIENSSSSESEDKVGKISKQKDVENVVIDRSECLNAGKNELSNKNNNETAESVLLASSDDSSNQSETSELKGRKECVNAKDDAISISETEVQKYSEGDKKDLTSKKILCKDSVESFDGSNKKQGVNCEDNSLLDGNDCEVKSSQSMEVTDNETQKIFEVSKDKQSKSIVEIKDKPPKSTEQIKDDPSESAQVIEDKSIRSTEHIEDQNRLIEKTNTSDRQEESSACRAEVVSIIDETVKEKETQDCNAVERDSGLDSTIISENTSHGDQGESSPQPTRQDKDSDRSKNKKETCAKSPFINNCEKHNTIERTERTSKESDTIDDDSQAFNDTDDVATDKDFNNKSLEAMLEDLKSNLANTEPQMASVLDS